MTKKDFKSEELRLEDERQWCWSCWKETEMGRPPRSFIEIVAKRLTLLEDIIANQKRLTTQLCNNLCDELKKKR